MATIKDVAKYAGVSISTVSNIINQKNNVSSMTYEKVVKAIEELNYNPSLMARNLKKQKTRMIIFILPSLDSYYSQIFQAAENILEENGYNVIVKVTNNDKYKEEKALDEALSLDVSGILIVLSDESNIKKIDSVLIKKIPVVFLERIVNKRDYTSVVLDNKNIIYEATSAIIREFKGQRGTGLKSLALITGPTEYSSELECLNGFISACDEIGKEIDYDIKQTSLDKEYSFMELIKIVKGYNNLPDCFITTNSSIVQSLSEALHVFGCKSKIFVLDGDDWCRNPHENSIVKIKRSAYELGLKGAKVLLEYIESPLLFENKQIVVEHRNSHDEKIGEVTQTKNRKLALLLLEGPTADALVELIPNFKRICNLEVEVVKCTYTDLYSKIIEEHKSESKDYDIFMIDLPWINSFVEQGYLLEMDNFINSDNDGFIMNFIDSIRNDFIHIGKRIYTLPIMASIEFLFYRRDLFADRDLQWKFNKQYGIELKPPKTWIEFNIIAEFFTKRYNPGSPVEFGTSIVGLDPTGIVDEFLPRQWSYGGRIASSKGEIVINSTENLIALKNLCTTYKYSPSDSLNYWWEDQVERFLDGDVAMIVAFASHMPRPSSKQFKIGYNNVKVSSIPGNTPMLGGWALGINKFTEAPEESYRFIKWATSDRTAIYNTLLGGLVPKKCVANNKQLHRCLPWLENLSSYLGSGKKRETVYNKHGQMLDPYIFEKTLAGELINAVAGRKTPEDALSHIKNKCEEIIEKG